VLIVGLVAFWQYYVVSKDIPPLYVPAPLEILDELAGNLGFFWEHTLVTLQEAGLALVIGSTIAGLAAALMAESSIADRAFLPAFVVIKVIPSIALVPVLVVALGLGVWPKVIIATLTLFYAVFINAVTGFKSVDEGALEVMKSVDASRKEIFFRLRLPNSLPYLFAAAKIGFPLAVLGAMFAELYTSKAGLGNVIAVAATRINMQTMWGAIFVLMFLGVLLVGIIGIVERRVLTWHSSQREL
jgi:NitT/TauT family transport system permease protein